MQSLVFSPVRLVLVLAGLTLLLSACSSAPMYKPTPLEQPSWTFHAVEFHSATKGRDAMVYTVGKAEGIPTLQAARSNADGKARKRMSVLFRQFVQAALEGYQQSGAPDEALAQAKQSLDDVGMGGAPIEDRFGHLNEGTWYSLASLPYSRFISLIVLNKRVPEAFSVWLKENATGLFTQLQTHWANHPDNVPSGKEETKQPEAPTQPGKADAPLDLKLKLNDFQE